MKHLLTLALVLCLGTFASAQIPGYVPTNGLVGWWPFNGNANDESGNGNHGTVNGATLAADRFGNAGKAYSFDGVDDNIVVSNSSSLNNNSVSLSGWFFTNTLPIDDNLSAKGIIGKWWQSPSICNDRYNAYLLCLTNPSINNGNQNTFLGGATSFYAGNDFYSSSSISIGTWYHFVFTHNSNLGGNLFINGNPVNSNSDSGQICNSINDINFGADVKNGLLYRFFNGLLDDIAIYNRALTAAEVQQLYLGNCTQPTFTAQPQNKSVAQGQTTSFAVQVDTTSTFQWQMDNGFGFVNLVNSSLFSGVTTNTLTVKGSNSIDGYSFRCIVTACQSDTSNAATLTVTSNSSTLGSVAGVPGKINYQGAAVDSAGKPMKNQTIALKLSVLDSSSSGAAVYVETHSTPTNGSGFFSLQIGGGTAVTGSFDGIPWANGRNKYLKTEVQQNGTWVNLGTSQLVSVPYALHAGSAENAKNASFIKDSLGNSIKIRYDENGKPFIALISIPINGCGLPVNHLGINYPTIQIGNQCWFQKNVNSGSMVLGVNDQTNNGILEKYCYNNDTANCSIYGGLYQWAEAVQYQNGASNTTSPSPAFSGNVKGICPTGWHVPSDGEFFTLSHYLDTSAVYSLFGTYSSIAGGALKSTRNLWNSPNTGATNNSGFSALPGGGLDYGHGFFGQGELTYFWTKSDFSVSPTDAIDIVLFFDYSIVFGDNITKSWGFSVRCLKD